MNKPDILQQETAGSQIFITSPSMYPRKITGMQYIWNQRSTSLQTVISHRINTEIRLWIFFTWSVTLGHAMYVAWIKHNTWNVLSPKVQHASMLFNDEYSYYGMQLSLFTGLAMLRVSYLYGNPVLSLLQMMWCLSNFMVHFWYHAAYPTKHYIPAVGIFLIPYIMFIWHFFFQLLPTITTHTERAGWTCFGIVNVTGAGVLTYNTVSGNWLNLRNAEYFCFTASCVIFVIVYYAPGPRPGHQQPLLFK